MSTALKHALKQLPVSIAFGLVMAEVAHLFVATFVYLLSRGTWLNPGLGTWSFLYCSGPAPAMAFAIAVIWPGYRFLSEYESAKDMTTEGDLEPEAQTCKCPCGWSQSLCGRTACVNKLPEQDRT